MMARFCIFLGRPSTIWLSSSIASVSLRHLPASAAAFHESLSRTATTIRLLAMSNSAVASPSPMYPRAAVAATIQWTQSIISPTKNLDYYYLLVQRANPPDQGLWSIPGGKIKLGESTLAAAQREIYEETQLETKHSISAEIMEGSISSPSNSGAVLQWHPDPFMTTDAIFKKSDDANTDDGYAFHYVIAHCFARIDAVDDGHPDTMPQLHPSDDALDAKWFSIAEIQNMKKAHLLSQGVLTVLERAEALSRFGALPVS